MNEDQHSGQLQVEQIASDAQRSVGRIEARLHEWQQSQHGQINDLRRQVTTINGHLAWYACAIVGLLGYIAYKLS